VDWAAGALDPNYVRAAVNTRLVGKQVNHIAIAAEKSWGKDASYIFLLLQNVIKMRPLV
jgi:hypothetical protein